jgi:hypothetical protein
VVVDVGDGDGARPRDARLPHREVDHLGALARGEGVLQGEGVRRGRDAEDELVGPSGRVDRDPQVAPVEGLETAYE